MCLEATNVDCGLYDRCSTWLIRVLQTHADYEHRLQEEVNARLLKEEELQELVRVAAMLAPCCIGNCSQLETSHILVCLAAGACSTQPLPSLVCFGVFFSLQPLPALVFCIRTRPCAGPTASMHAARQPHHHALLHIAISLLLLCCLRFLPVHDELLQW